MVDGFLRKRILRKCMIFDRLSMCQVFNIYMPVRLSLPLNLDMSLNALCCTISKLFIWYPRGAYHTDAAYSKRGLHRLMHVNNKASFGAS